MARTATGGAAARQAVPQEGPVVDRLKDERYRELVRRRSEELEQRLVKRDTVSDKVVFQEEMSYMRRAMAKERSGINLTYPVNPPYAFVHVTFDQDAGELSYAIKEPKLKEGERELLAVIKERMEATMDQDELPAGDTTALMKSREVSEYLRRKYEDVLDLYDIPVEEKRKPVLLYYLERELLGLGRIDPVLKDPFIEDISCNGPQTPIFVYHRVFGSLKTNVAYAGDIELNRYIFKLAQVSGKHISIYQPILDATLQDGSRINLTLGTEVTRGGSTFSIRKFSYDPISPIDLMRFGSVSPLALAYFWTLIDNKRSVLMSGGTASGKTTLLNALCMFVRPEDKIVSIEDTPEIHIDHTNWIQSVARTGYGASGVSGVGGASGVSGVSGVGSAGGKPGSITLFDLLVAALRQRPEYVIVGEVRGREAFTLFQAIAVGHASMATVHAGSIDELIHRVENEPMNVPRVLFQSLDAVAFQGQVVVDGKRLRRVKAVTEVLDVERDTKNLLTNEVFTWDPRTDSFAFQGRSFILEEIARQAGKSIDEVMGEVRRREAYIKLMDERNLTYYKDVSRAINTYYVDPVAAVRRLEEQTAG